MPEEELEQNILSEVLDAAFDDDILDAEEEEEEDLDEEDEEDIDMDEFDDIDDF